MAENLGVVKVTRKTGDETFHANGTSIGTKLSNFWQWSSSDLLNNAWRGIVAEYIVAHALGLADGTRVEWDAYDLITPSGVKIEVKSAAYLQTWHQNDYSKIQFGVQPTLAWDYTTGKYETEQRRQADVYVFCLLSHKDKSTVDPLDVTQWEFYLLPTATLNERLSPTQAGMSFSILLKMNPTKVFYADLAEKINDLCIAHLRTKE